MVVLAGFFGGGRVLLVHSQESKANPQKDDGPPDAVLNAQTLNTVTLERVEQKKTAHDRSNVFDPRDAARSSDALLQQPQEGAMNGFDFYRDPLGAMKPGMTFEEVYQSLSAEKPNVTARQRKLLESRYNLDPKFDPNVTMSRGKRLVVGPTAKLAEGMDWDTLAAMKPDEVRDRDIFPYKALPHPAQGGGLGGQVFPPMQIKMFPRLERYDVDFDLPEAFLPEFPPAMYLQNRRSWGTFLAARSCRSTTTIARTQRAVPDRRLQPPK